LREHKVQEFDGLLKIALAEAEAEAGDSDCALRLVDKALVTVEGTGVRTFESELHRERNPAQVRSHSSGGSGRRLPLRRRRRK
jgi:hypothetical protein